MIYIVNIKKWFQDLFIISDEAFSALPSQPIDYSDAKKSKSNSPSLYIDCPSPPPNDGVTPENTSICTPQITEETKNPGFYLEHPPVQQDISPGVYTLHFTMLNIYYLNQGIYVKEWKWVVIIVKSCTYGNYKLEWNDNGGTRGIKFIFLIKDSLI